MDKDKCGGQGHDEKRDSCALKEVFKSFAQADDKGSTGESIGLKNVEKWLGKAGLLGDDKGSMSSSDLSTSFQKVAKGKERINMTEFRQLIEDMAKSKKMEINEVWMKLIGASSPGLSAVKDVLSTGKDAVKNLMGSEKEQDASKDKEDPLSSVKDAAKNVMGCGKGQEASKDEDDMDKDMGAKKK